MYNDLFAGCRSGKDFEIRVEKILTHLGFRVKSTGKDDNGIDLIAEGELEGQQLCYYIQCKYWNKTVDKSPIQEVIAGAKFLGEKGVPVVVTNNSFTIGAKEYAKRLGVELISELDWIELERTNEVRAVVHSEPRGLLGIMLGLLAQDRGIIEKSLPVPVRSAEMYTEEMRFNEVMDTFNKSQALLREASESQLHTDRIRQAAITLQKEAFFKVLRYG